MLDYRISVIIPCYNEEKVIGETYKRVKKALTNAGYVNFEILFVNDGSFDRTLNILKHIAESDKRVKVVSFSRNFGHEAATSAGINNCGGELAFIIDADLQDPPELFPKMIKTYNEKKCNVVYGVRKHRQKETIIKKFTSILFYRLFNYLSDSKSPPDTGDFRLMDRAVIESYKRFGEKNKYVRGIISWIGFKQVPFFYEREPRLSGTTKYSYRKLIALAFNAIFYFSKKPLRIATSLGFLSVMIGLALSLYVYVGRFYNPVPGWASTLLIIIFFGGVQLLTIGILGQYTGNILDEVKNRPEYIIDEEINF
ncbi:MAG: glycosyltransferase family 2 protein [candidate division Zixibacteria bacterium]|nr:glycosyltransferase family 2 protein [candidate division Zixibacteria bacterium]